MKEKRYKIFEQFKNMDKGEPDACSVKKALFSFLSPFVEFCTDYRCRKIMA
jgi:hypothetical protein